MSEINLDPIARLREMNAAQQAADEPPTEAESWGYIETVTRANDPLPKRRFSGLFWWLLVFATFAFLSGAVFKASYARADGVSLARCAENLADLTDPGIMGRATARRLGRAWCVKMERAGGQWWRAVR